MATAPPIRTVFDIITDFLASNPTPEAILAFQLSDALKDRAIDLLERYKAEDLSFDEELEMYDFMRADDMMSLLKAKTRLKLSKDAE